MKPTTPPLGDLVQRTMACMGLCTLMAAGQAAPGAADSGGDLLAPANRRERDAPVTPNPPPSSPVTVNRTVPPVDLPRSPLHLPANPTALEIFRTRAFEEPLVPVGGEPLPAENAALATTLANYGERTGPDDFSSLTDFLEKHPASPWRAALLTNLGIEYYNTARYSKTMETWSEAWNLAKEALDPPGKAIADRAAGELAFMYARLGMMTELEALLKSVEGRVFVGAATERIDGAREGLWSMQNRPEESFRCGPLALHRIKLLTDPRNSGANEIFGSASTEKGFSLPQVAELSDRIGLGYQMAFRETDGALIVPSVVHWKVGHYAALIRQEGDRYLLQDPTFGNDVWASRRTLELETSGYFLVPPGDLPRGWRAVETGEGSSVWGKGTTTGNELGPTTRRDPKPKPKWCRGMAVSSVHLMLANLNLEDEPVGYSPPVGPDVRFTVTYNHREAFQPANFTYSNFGPKWTCDWIAYITDNPQSLSADVNYFARGGGTRTFTGFNSATQSFASQQFDQTLLTRTGNSSYQMVSGDGSRMIFSRSDGSIGTSRKIFLTQILDPFGNALTLTYDGSLRLVAITDAIGQVTTLSHAHPTDIYKITKVTDPFGRFATFDYDASNRLTKITDVIGLTSQFTYEGTGDFIHSLVTPYGTTSFTRQQSGGANGTTRFVETTYPDGSRDRVEYNQFAPVPASDPAGSVPAGMATTNLFLLRRNTYYWSRLACATAYGDYSKAKIFHWLHGGDGTITSGILESTKEPLEGRVWYGYAGQGSPSLVGASNRPTHVGRVLDDGSTQLHTYTYDGFGHVTNSIDPLGRSMSYVYATNGIDLLEVRQTRAGNSELLALNTYNAQHLPLTRTDASGQVSRFTYNARGQMLTATNPKNETTSYTYDSDGYLVMVDGPLPGASDSVSATYDSYGRTRTRTDESGYTITLDYDALDRLTKITHPDGTFTEYLFDRLDVVGILDRAGRPTLMEYDAMGQMNKRTDPLNRVMLFQWCSCGDLSSLTDPMGRTTAWQKDVQGRLTEKRYGDGSRISYFYENAGGRLRQVVDEKQQVREFAYHRDDTLRSATYANTTTPTPGVSYTYDPDYQRVRSMTDGTGTTIYTYTPVTAAPAFGSGRLASVDGPLPDDTISYGYDELGRPVSTAIRGVTEVMTYDPAGRVIAESNALGAFSRAYDGGSARLVLNSFPNGQTEERAYAGNLEDRELKRITHKVGATPVSEFNYGHDVTANRISTWSQQAGAQPALLHTFGYDAADQLLSATITRDGAPAGAFAYTYDSVENRLTEQAGAASYSASYNALNQISVSTAPGASRTNEWDAKDRLVAVTAGNQRTEFTYDGLSQLASLRLLTNGVQTSLRRFVWCDGRIREERDGAGTVTKRFFHHGMKIEGGPDSGAYYYTRDHLGSIREVTDSSGNVRARYSYDPFGLRTRVGGDMDADFGFAGMFFSVESGLFLTTFRAYDPELGRWLSRDPMRDAEIKEGPNLYAYVGNNPVNMIDPLGLEGKECCQTEWKELENWRGSCGRHLQMTASRCDFALRKTPEIAIEVCAEGVISSAELCSDVSKFVKEDAWAYLQCMTHSKCGLERPRCPSPPRDPPSLSPGPLPSGDSEYYYSLGEAIEDGRR